jgi:hypothetical protein
MRMEKSVGSIVVTENGNVILLTALDIQGEMQGSGIVPVFDSGVVLRGKRPTGERIRMLSIENVRVAGHLSEALRLLEQSGVDLTTRPERSLTPLERIERLEQENAQLRTNARG